MLARSGSRSDKLDAGGSSLQRMRNEMGAIWYKLKKRGYEWFKTKALGKKRYAAQRRTFQCKTIRNNEGDKIWVRRRGWAESPQPKATVSRSEQGQEQHEEYVPSWCRNQPSRKRQGSKKKPQRPRKRREVTNEDGFKKDNLVRITRDSTGNPFKGYVRTNREGKIVVLSRVTRKCVFYMELDDDGNKKERRKSNDNVAFVAANGLPNWMV